MVFVLNRFLGDNVQRLDPARGLTTRFQCSTGPASNPHDIVAVAPDKAYVTRYDRAELWVVDPSVADCTRFRRGTIDIRAFADGDELPEMSQLALVDQSLFVTVQRLDRRRGFASTGPSRMVVVDTVTDTVSGEIVLHGGNPFGDASGIAREPETGKLVIASAGDIFRVGDGGLERIDPATRTAEGAFFVDETTLGGNILDFVLVSATKGYAVLQDAALANRLVVFDPSGAAAPRTLYAREAFLPDIVLGPDGFVWLADQGLPNPGLRIFDPATDRALSAKPLGVGLPPFSIGFVP
jgi:DNA-binding beta-propeller fold protein YncE